ncbi:MAG: excisionase [Spirochaetaceae bacterium]|jgi:hypothetical protein|nr:excisionase [Spirochaetaceae bacterium]
MTHILMHKRLEVASVEVDDVMGVILRINEIFVPAHMPLGVPPETTVNAIKLLNEWWQGRAIPASRSGLREALEILKISSPVLLLEKCYGLSLSDHYWMRPANKDLQWDKINFFENPFSDDVGNALFGHDSGKNISLSSPDNTSDGWLKKKWKIAEGKRVLLKGGSPVYHQEPDNEVLATAIMERLAIPHAVYCIVHEKRQGEERHLSACEDFVDTNSELVSAWRIYCTKKPEPKATYYEHFISCCKDLGIPGVDDFFDRMLTVDFIMVNADRHFNNFGALRNPETLEWIGPAPIFDTGTSMWYDQVNERIHPEWDAKSKPFVAKHSRQKKLIKSLDWFKAEALDGIKEEAASIYSSNHLINAERRKILSSALDTRIKILLE